MTDFNPQVHRPCVATIGFFDGMHRGHRFLITQVLRIARERNLASAAITFPVHPRKVMQADFRPLLLSTCQEKCRLLATTGIDYCFMPAFSPELSKLSAREFMLKLKTDYNVQTLVIGYDHRFGHNRAEGFDDYVRHGHEIGMEVLQAEELPTATLQIGEEAKEAIAEGVSSSAIRRLLQAGDVETAAELLGYPYFVEGTVVDGHRVGREIGFPTANICPDDADKIVPAGGVYVVNAHIGGAVYQGMLNIGRRPTLNNGTDRSIEVNLFHFDADIYGADIQIDFIGRLRSEMKFESVEALKAQLAQDRKDAEALLKLCVKIDNAHR